MPVVGCWGYVGVSEVVGVSSCCLELHLMFLFVVVFGCGKLPSYLLLHVLCAVEVCGCP